MTAWDELAPLVRAAVDDLVAEAVRTGAWPQPWQLARIERLQRALGSTEDALATLATRTGVEVSDAAGTVVRATGEHEPRLIASQLPAAEQAAATTRFAARILPTALDGIVSRSQAQIAAATRPLSTQALTAVRRELVRGIAVGDNPRTMARQMVARTEGEFNGGLARAMNIARTETLDAYRTASRYAHAANGDVVAGWVWLATLDRRTCPSCWSMHGSVHPVDEPGPLDHQQGRCARVPKTKSWRDLGINLDEPPDLIPDAQAKFWAMPEADQLQVMGSRRLEVLRSGQASWSDLSTRRESVDWRASYTPTPVRDLARSAT